MMISNGCFGIPAHFGGQMVEVHIVRRHLYDENLGAEILAGTMITLLIRYAVMEAVGRETLRIQRRTRLVFSGVSDFSFFEQEGANSGTIEALQAEWKDGSFRFWFDQYGEVYIVCDEAELEEVGVPEGAPGRDILHEWVFQAQQGTLPTVEWLLDELDRAGCACTWRPGGVECAASGRFEWSGFLSRHVPVDQNQMGTVAIQGYGPLGEHSFGIVARVRGSAGGAELLAQLAHVLTTHFSGHSIGLESATLQRVRRSERD